MQMPFVRENRFPIFKTHPNLVYLDSASTTQRVDRSLEAMENYFKNFNANVHRGLYSLSEQATVEYEKVREKTARFLNAQSSSEIIFTRGATESLNMVAQGWGGQFLKAGDEILLTILEHHSNIVPWHLIAKRTGAILKFCPLDDAYFGSLDMQAFEQLLTAKTKIVSVTGLSNALGTLTDLKKIRELTKKVGALLCVDAAQLVAHFPIDVRDLDVDFLAFSSHKLYGPTGAGVLYAKREHLEKMDPWLGGGNMIREVHTTHSTWNDVPWKFEAGTPPIAEVIGLGGAIQFIEELGWDWTAKHDLELQDYAFQCFNALKHVQVYGPQNNFSHRAVVSFGVKDVHAHDVAAVLGERDVCVRGGHHCAMPLMKALNLTSTTRMSFGVYNTKQDVDRLVDGLGDVANLFKL